MPVKIGTFGPLSEAEFTELLRQKALKGDPAMTALLNEIATGRPVRVPLGGAERTRPVDRHQPDGVEPGSLRGNPRRRGLRRGAEGR